MEGWEIFFKCISENSAYKYSKGGNKLHDLSHRCVNHPSPPKIISMYSFSFLENWQVGRKLSNGTWNGMLKDVYEGVSCPPKFIDNKKSIKKYLNPINLVQFAYR